MALSYSFFPDRDTIIKAALRRIRAYDPEESTTISTVQYNNAAETLNFILSHWQALGLPIWCRKTVSCSFVDGDKDYTIGTGGDINTEQPLAILDAWRRDLTDATNPIDTPLRIIGEQEYNRLSTKSSEGVPSQIFFKKEYNGTSNSGATADSVIYVWPVPDSTTATNIDLYVVVQRPLLDFGATADVLDMPQEWFEAIRLNLAYKIAPEYGCPAMEYDRLTSEAKAALDLALAWDTEQVSLYFSPNLGYRA